MTDRLALMRDCDLRDLVEQLDKVATRLVDCHDTWLLGEVLPEIRRTNSYHGGSAAIALARIDAPSIADTILKAAAYLHELRMRG